MSRVTKVSSHLSEEEIQALLRAPEGQRHRDKLMVILNAIVDPRHAKEIALHVNVSVHAVHLWIPTCNRFGLKALFGPGPGGRCNQHMTKEEESPFLELF